MARIITSSTWQKIPVGIVAWAVPGFVSQDPEKRLYIIPYPEVRADLEAHFADILAALPPEDSDPEGVAKRNSEIAEYRKDLIEQQYNT